MDATDKLVDKLKARGLDVDRVQAEAMAVRLSGSVDAYLAELARNDEAAANYKPLDVPADQVPEKFKDGLSYSIEKPDAA